MISDSDYYIILYYCIVLYCIVLYCIVLLKYQDLKSYSVGLLALCRTDHSLF